MLATEAISLILTIISTLAKLEPTFVATWDNLKPFGIALYEKLTGQTISSEDQATLEAQLDTLHDQFQQPLPPDNPPAKP